jgi:hypothetical protein
MAENKDRGKLNEANFAKFSLHLKSAKYASYLLIITILEGIFILNYSSVNLYLDERMHYTISNLLVNSFHMVLITYSIMTVIFGALMEFLAISFYLQYRFKQVNQNISKVSKISEINEIIKEHNEIASLTTKLNQTNSLLMFYCYFGLTAIIDVAIYLTISDQVILIARLYTFTGALFLFIVSSWAAYNIADVSKYAHRPYKKLNSLMARSVNTPLKLKFKIITQIERLSKHRPIAIYCLNLFPFTHRESFNFIMGWMTSYFLWLSFIEYFNLQNYQAFLKMVENKSNQENFYLTF